MQSNLIHASFDLWLLFQLGKKNTLGRHRAKSFALTSPQVLPPQIITKALNKRANMMSSFD